MKLRGLAILSILSFAGCKSNEAEITNKQNFTFFELAYSNGLTKGFTFRVDSSAIFFVPQTMDLVQYGLLPDSMVRLIDSTLAKMLRDSSITSRAENCADCSLVAVIARVGDRDIRIIQSGKVDTVFLSIVNKV